MHVIDVNTSFGKRLNDDPRYSAESLAKELDRHRVACSLSHSQKGVYYSAPSGNEESLAAAQRFSQLVPVGTLDPRDDPAWRAELRKCLKQGVRAFRFFPGPQYWSPSSTAFKQVLRELSGSGVCLIFSLGEENTSADSSERIAQATAEAALPVILTDISYASHAFVMALMREHPHIYAETNWLAGVGNIETMASEVGAARLLYGSGAPAFPIQKALNMVLETELSRDEKEAILGGNAMKLLRLTPAQFAARPELTDLEPRKFDEEIIDVHSHLGYWFCCNPHEGHDPSGMLRRMKRFGISHSVLSSYETMRYDIVSGNRALAQGIEGHPELLGYVELNPNQLALSIGEMEKYYRLPNFVGCEMELDHIARPMGADRDLLHRLMAEVARRGKPILFRPPNSDDGTLERDLALQNPQLRIVHAHGFDANWARVVADAPNIAVEFNRSRPSHHDIRDVLSILGPERVLFGTDQTLLSVGSSVGAYLDAELTAAERKLVLSGNARRLFRLPVEVHGGFG